MHTKSNFVKRDVIKRWGRRGVLMIVLGLWLVAGGDGQVARAAAKGQIGPTGISADAPAAPILLAPDMDMTITGVLAPPVGVPTLMWQAAPNADQYNVQISASAGFAATIVNATTYATTYTPIILLADGVYYSACARCSRQYVGTVFDGTFVYQGLEQWRRCAPPTVGPGSRRPLACFWPR